MSNETPDRKYALDRLRGVVRPPLTITSPPVGTVDVQRDLPVPMRDGTILRVNVFRPKTPGRYPVLMCAHPYRKDALPKGSAGKYAPPFQYRIFRLPAPIRFSAWTGWESPDPAFWVPQGYVLVNADLRGFGTSEGQGPLMSAAEGDDYHDLIEWAAKQEWSTGNVGLSGVSYLALSQWRAAATRPPSLKAISPWEGFSDFYRDFARPGGVREDGFIRVWAKGLAQAGRPWTDVRAEQVARPLWDDWWQARLPDLERINVPALVCASFSDQSLHTRGTFDAFGRIGSADKWLYTHRGGKWSVYYSDEAKAFQKRFFDCFLKGEENGMRQEPRVRLEVRERGDVVHEVRGETSWPLPATQWTPLHLHAGSLREEPGRARGATEFHSRSGRASFTWSVQRDVELTGPMKLKVFLSSPNLADVALFVGVRKLDANGEHVVFEGSYGFGHDLVARGSLKVSQRALDPHRSTPWRPFHTHLSPEPLHRDQVVPLEVEILPSSTLFRAGETLRLDVQARPFFSKLPLFGQFPGGYEASGTGTIALHFGGELDSHLLVPVIR
jgi:predicted acyl esterase